MKTFFILVAVKKAISFDSFETKCYFEYFGENPCFERYFADIEAILFALCTRLIFI